MGSSVLIMGGGLGGLVTGAILAKEGFEVTVLEKNAVPGGGLQSYSRWGETFDTGMHVFGGLGEGTALRRLYDWLGVSPKMQLVPEDRDCCAELHFGDSGETYRIASGGPEAFVESLCRYFPSQRENLKAYVKALHSIVSELDTFNLRPADSIFQKHGEDFNLSFDAFIAKYLTDSTLRSIVAYMNPYYGGVRGQTPAYVHAVLSELFIRGTWRFAGGSVRFARTLEETIVANGGKVIRNEAVTGVTGENGLVSSVLGQSGRKYFADNYICAFHPCTLFPLMEDEALLGKAYRRRLESLPNAGSAFCINIKLKKDSFPYINHSCHYYASASAVYDFGASCPEGKWPPGFLYMTPPASEQGVYASTMSITAPMLWQEVSRWENSLTGHRDAEYMEWKKERCALVLDIVESLHQGFRSYIEALDCASPLSIRDWYGVKQGSMCGFSKDCSKSELSTVGVRTKVPNLLLTGQNCSLHGLCGVSLTAVNTAEALLGADHILSKLRSR